MLQLLVSLAQFGADLRAGNPRYRWFGTICKLATPACVDRNTGVYVGHIFRAQGEAQIRARSPGLSNTVLTPRN